MTTAPPASPLSLRAQVVFWLLLGSLSVILAEVVSSSSLFPFFDVWGLVIVFPLYTLHVLVLVGVIFRRHQVTLRILFLAGALLGLYEAYLTKVLWDPTWGQTMQLTFGGVYVIHTAVLVLFWHPLMAFMLPVMLAEWFFTPSSETFIALPEYLRTRLTNPRQRVVVVCSFACYCGIYQSGASPSPVVSLISIGGAGLVFALFAYLWNRVSGKTQLDLRVLLPSRRQTIVFGGLLLLVYLVQTFTLRPDSLPRTLVPHLVIWLLYALFIALLVRNINHAPPAPAERHPSPLYRRWKILLIFWIVFALSAAVFSVVKDLAFLIALASWFVGVACGLVLLFRSAFRSN